MEEELVKQDLSSASSVAEPIINAISHYYDPAQVALCDSLVLKSVFKHMSQPSLKKCLKVCPTWSQISKSFIHPTAVIQLTYDHYPLKSLETLPIFPNLNRISALPDTYYDRQLDFEGLVEPMLSEIQKLDKTPHLKFCFLPNSRNRWPEEMKNDARKLGSIDLINFIKNTSHLRVLDVWNERVPQSFWNALLEPEDLAGNPRLKQTLESLSIVGPKRGVVDALREKNLQLKILILEILEKDAYRERHGNDLVGFDLWPLLSDMSSTLEYLCLVKRNDYYCRRPVGVWTKFITEMKLKTLRIDRTGYYGANDLIALIKHLPNLETLTLMDAKSTGVKQTNYVNGAFDEFAHPSLKEFKIDTHKFNPKDWPPYDYVPELFPNLRKLAMNVYSKNFFLNCIYALKDTMIEELELNLKCVPKPKNKAFADYVIPCFPSWGLKLPSLNAWKKLRKLSLGSRSLHYYKEERKPLPEGCSTRKIYDIPLEKVLPKGLTSLELESFEKFELGFLLKLVTGLPSLMDLKVDEGSVADEYGNLMELPVLRDKMAKNPSMHPFLHVRFE